MQELREEQENLSHNQQNTILSPLNEEDFLGLSLDWDDFNFMERYIIIDLP